MRAAQRAFYFQRAFTSIVARHAEGPWVHGDDRRLAPPGVRGGWHDAGDYSVYSASLNTALFWMLEAYSDFFRKTTGDFNKISEGPPNAGAKNVTQITIPGSAFKNSGAVVPAAFLGGAAGPSRSALRRRRSGRRAIPPPASPVA